MIDQKAHEERLQVLYEHSSDGYLLFDEHGIIDCNPAVIQMLRCADKKHVLSLHPAQLSPERQPDGRRSLEKSIEMDQTARERGHHRFEWIHRKMDGEDFPVEVVLTPVSLGGKPALLALWHDLTDRKRAEKALMESEARFRTLANSSPIGIFQIDAEGLCTYANPRCQQITGLTPEESLGTGWLRSIHPEDRAAMMDEWRRARDETNDFSLELRLLRPDGTVRQVLSRAVALRAASGQILSYVGTVVDITERKVIERMKSEFVSIVSHELRTPLTSIRGALRLLEGGIMGELPEDAMSLVSMASANTERLVRLINDILDVEKLEAGRMVLQVRRLDPRRLLLTTVEGLRGLAEQARVSLVIEGDERPEDDERWLQGDEDLLVQVLTNLVSNAIKFSPPGSQVRLRVERTPALNGWLRFSVMDQGPGIAADDLPKLFGKFQQLDSSNARKKGGTGLGLAISKAIVEEHGGRIGLDSRPGEGTTFWFDLPLPGAR
ncbi:MAG TPA: PAS domain S-box protein [Polyangia bacterium]|nr:PAS domain S-box protein [Polyangia bacterium]